MLKICSLLLCLLLCAGAPTLADEDVSIFATPTPTASPVTADTDTSGGEQVLAQESSPLVPLLADGSTVITVSALGDLTFGGDVRKRGLSIFDQELKKQGDDLSFVTRNMREMLNEDDMTLVNFETTLTTAPVYKKNNDFVFSAPPEYVNILTTGGIEAVSFENNHAMDHGDTGIAETRSHLDTAGIVWSAEEHAGYFEVKGVRIAMLAYQTFNNQYPRLFEKVPLDIAAARAQADVVIVSYHWGDELDYKPNSNQQALGRRTIEAGADLVVGHHSHRINPIEYYQGKYIVYSLANFSFAGNSKPSDMSSFMFQVRFHVKDGQTQTSAFRIVPFRISSKTDYNDFIPTPFTDQRHIDNVINVLKSNGRELEYAVPDYPVEWE